MILLFVFSSKYWWQKCIIFLDTTCTSHNGLQLDGMANSKNYCTYQLHIMKVKVIVKWPPIKMFYELIIRKWPFSQCRRNLTTCNTFIYKTDAFKESTSHKKNVSLCTLWTCNDNTTSAKLFYKSIKKYVHLFRISIMNNMNQLNAIFLLTWTYLRSPNELPNPSSRIDGLYWLYGKYVVYKLSPPSIWSLKMVENI